jgi:3-deoxy-7-phosphoheptulonate synthase
MDRRAQVGASLDYATAADLLAAWRPGSWRDHPADQQPDWPDEGELDRVLKQMAALPPLVFPAEARDLTDELAEVAAGRAFLLQAGDCAESFDSFSADSVRERLRIILQMAVVLTYSSGLPTVKIGRIAGQFAKPRSAGLETVEGVALPSFRGHMVNDIAFDESARLPDPERLLQAYHQSAATLNLLRSLTKGGFADLSQVHSWTQGFVVESPEGTRYQQVADEIDRALRFMKACGVDTISMPTLHEVDFFTSHEALILGYEEALTRRDALTGEWFDASAHMVWIGERTRRVDGAHMEFCAGIRNPVGCKLGPTTTPDEVLAVCERLNPRRVPGRLTLITRMGAGRVREHLPPLLSAVRDAGHPVVWTCDPMHGNTFSAAGGQKTRRLGDVLAEIAGFFAAHRQEGTVPGGVHVELTSDDVTECLGGSWEILESGLGDRYETMCDPRLNGRQSLDLAFQVAELLRAG